MLKAVKPQFKTPKIPVHAHPPGCACKLGVAYLRVSKVGKREKLISPKMQMESIIGWAKDNHVRLVDVYSDIDRSGRTFRKRSVDRIISRIEHGDFEHVVLWKWSRWSRGVANSTEYAKRVRDAGGRVDSATEDFDLDTAIGKLHWQINMAFDEYVSNAIIETWHGVFDLRREDGLPHDGRARFGYDYIEYETRDEDGDKIKKRKYVINSGQADALNLAYVKFNARVWSFEQIAFELNGAGFVTTQGGRWTAQGTARMMDTGFAAGLIRERSKPTDQPANSIRSYDVWREGAHDPIVTDEVWQIYKARRTHSADLPARARKACHELSALVFCGVCHRRMQSKHMGAARTHQWTCTWQKAHHPSVAVSASNRLLLGLVKDEVHKLAGDRATEIDAKAREDFKRLQSGTSAPTRASLEKDLDRWTRKLSKLYDLWTDDDIEPEDYRRKKSEYETGRDAVQGKLNALPDAEIKGPDYRAFRALDEAWGSFDAPLLRDALAALYGGFVVMPRTESSSNASVADRVECVGLWDARRLARMQLSA